MMVVELHKYDRMPVPEPKPVVAPHEALYRRRPPRKEDHHVDPRPFWRVWLDSRN